MNKLGVFSQWIGRGSLGLCVLMICVLPALAQGGSKRPAPPPSYPPERVIIPHSHSDQPATRLDSVLSFSSYHESVGSPLVASKIEHYVTEFPNSAPLMLAVGRSFLYNSVYYNARTSGSRSCEDTINYDFSDSAFHWISLAVRTDRTLRDPEFDLPIRSWLAQAYSSLILDKIRAHDAPTVRRMLINAMLDSVIDPFSLDFATESMAETPKEGLLITRYTEAGSNMLLPLWFLQVVERKRTDLSIIVTSFLADDAYYNLVQTGLEGVARGVRVSPHFLVSSSDEVDSRLPPQVLEDTAFIAQNYRTRLKRETGIEQPSFLIVNIPHVKTSATDRLHLLVAGNGWKRPVYACPFFPDGFVEQRATGFVSEWLPMNDSTADEYFSREPQLNGIVQLFEASTFGHFLERMDHDHFGDLPLWFAGLYLNRAVPTSAEYRRVISSFWKMRMENDTTNALKVVKLLLPVIDSNPPPGAAKFAEGVVDKLVSREKLLGTTYCNWEESSELYVSVKSALGKCDEVHRLSNFAEYLSLTDTSANAGFYANFDQLLRDDAVHVHCDWVYPRVVLNKESVPTPAPPALSHNHRRPTRIQSDNSERVWRSGDTLSFTMAVFTKDPTSRITIKWYYENNSTLVRTDSMVVASNIKQVVNGRASIFNEGHALVKFLLTHDLPPQGRYRADVLCNGVFADAITFNVGEKDATE